MEHGSKIKWGAIIAGAALVAGAILFAPTLFPGVGAWLTGIVSGSAATAAAVTPAAAAVTNPLGVAALVGGSAAGTVGGAAGGVAAITTTVAPVAVVASGIQKLAGLAIAGMGAAYFMRGKGTEELDRQLAREADMGFAMKEQTRVMQTKMLLQAAYAGNPQAQAMLAGNARG